MAYSVFFELNGERVAESLAEPALMPGEVRPFDSMAFFCSECGEVWARVHVPGRYYVPMSVDCEKHAARSPFHFPGSLWISWLPEYLACLPREVLLREFNLHLQHFESYSHDSRY